jgi:TrmH family RNA methyltransferase
MSRLSSRKTSSPASKRFPHLDNLSVVLVSTRNPLNIGAAARAMSNFGFSSLRIVNPYRVAFREARSAVGASQLLRNAREFTNRAEAVDDCVAVVGTTAARNRDLKQVVRTPQQGAALIRKKLATGRVALLFGSEKRGLSNDDISECNWLMRIPTRSEHPSMNLGQAVAVCLYEIARDRAPLRFPAQPAQATAADLDRLTATLTEALLTSGYLRGQGQNQEKIRRLVRRFKLSGEDAQLWLGMVRQMIWKMQN